MTPIVKNCSIIIWGTATRDASLRQTGTGKSVSGFGMKYNRRHNENGQMVSEYMEVSMWGENAKFVGDPDLGIAKGDSVLVCGVLVEDNFRKDGEDPDVEKWKIDADIVIDMTSIFQVAQMVVGGDVQTTATPAEIPTTASVFSELDDEKTPFEKELEESDTDLPY